MIVVYRDFIRQPAVNAGEDDRHDAADDEQRVFGAEAHLNVCRAECRLQVEERSLVHESQGCKGNEQGVEAFVAGNYRIYEKHSKARNEADCALI